MRGHALRSKQHCDRRRIGISFVCIAVVYAIVNWDMTTEVDGSPTAAQQPSPLRTATPRAVPSAGGLQWYPPLCHTLPYQLCERCTRRPNRTFQHCFNGCQCPSEGCEVVPVNGSQEHACTDSALWKTSSLSAHCVAPKEKIHPEELPLQLHSFAKKTAWLFHEWESWDSSCGSRDNGTTRRLRGYHDKDNLYVLENVCFHPTMGNMLGFDPQLDPFHGSNEIAEENSGFNQSVSDVAVKKWMVVAVPLPHPPSCLKEEPIALFHASEFLDNHIHAIHKGMAVRLAREKNHHLSSVVNPLTLMVVHRALFDVGGAALEYAKSMYFKRWASIFGFPFLPSDAPHARRRFVATRIPDPASEPMALKINESELACFRKVVVVLPSYRSASNDDNPYLMRVNGPRRPQDAQLYRRVREDVALCAGADYPRTADKKNPKIVIAVRSLNRKILGLAYHIRAIESFAKEELHARSVAVVEFSRLKLSEVAQIHLDADILVGFYGSGLSWVMLMPPQSVLVEFFSMYSCTERSLNRSTWGDAEQVRHCDFQGLASSLGISMLSIKVPDVARVRGGAYVSLTAWKETLRLAVCGLQFGAAQCPIPCPDCFGFEKLQH